MRQDETRMVSPALHVCCDSPSPPLSAPPRLPLIPQSGSPGTASFTNLGAAGSACVYLVSQIPLDR